jgi:hypothetical protein
MMDAVNTVETSVRFYQTTQHNVPEYSHFHTCRREDLKSHHFNIILAYRALFDFSKQVVNTVNESSNFVFSTPKMHIFVRIFFMFAVYDLNVVNGSIIHRLT